MQQFFLQCQRGVFIALFFTFAADLQAASWLRYIFGSQPVSAEIQQVSGVADKMTNFETTVLKMNKLSKKLGYSSFNWFNTTWVDEDGVSAKSKNALLRQLIHEKYHTIGGHDWRRIVGVCAVATSLIRGLVTAYAKYDAGLDLGIVVPYSLPATFLALFLFLWHEEYCESQADAYADHVMRAGIIASEHN
jgi:hypothetical protein